MLLDSRIWLKLCSLILNDLLVIIFAAIEAIEVFAIILLNLVGYSIDWILYPLDDVMAEWFGWNFIFFESFALS